MTGHDARAGTRGATRALRRLFGRPSVGLRLWPHDPLVLVAVLAGSWHWRDALHPFTPLPSLVLAHFFLFCNIVRLRRRFELIWAAAFIVNILLHASASADGGPAWGAILALQTPLTVGLAAAEFRSPDYHGVLARLAPNARVNDRFHPRREAATDERREEHPMPETDLRLTIPAETLRRDHPPRVSHPNKAAVLARAAPEGMPWSGTVEVTRHPAVPLAWIGPAGTTEILVRPDFYDYESTGMPAAALEWHVNFADPDLFGYHGGGLFAQDEMQVAEHPALASVREVLLARGAARTVAADGTPTPVLVRGVERRVRIRIDASPADGRPDGLYGNRFSEASPDAVRRATEPLAPPTVTNLVALAAPRGGGLYDRLQLSRILHTAHAGFAAARAETRRALGDDAATVVHTGFWGCGAFGGNRTVMIALQVVAARAAGIDRLVLHAGNGTGVADARAGVAIADPLLGAARRPTADLVEDLFRMGFRWGVGDGN